MTNQNPEQKTRNHLDKQLTACGWVVFKSSGAKNKDVFLSSLETLNKSINILLNRKKRVVTKIITYDYHSYVDLNLFGWSANDLSTGFYNRVKWYEGQLMTIVAQRIPVIKFGKEFGIEKGDSEVISSIDLKLINNKDVRLIDELKSLIR